MGKVIVCLMLLLGKCMQAQTAYETNMRAGMEVLEIKPYEAIPYLENSATSQPLDWLPHYYIALAQITLAMDETDFSKFRQNADQAQLSIHRCLALEADESEVYVLQGMLYTAWILFDPQSNGPLYGGKAQMAFEKAVQYNPNNPRAQLALLEYEYHSSAFMGLDTQTICEGTAEVLELFTTFKSKTSWHPSWGDNRIEALIENCKK